MNATTKKTIVTTAVMGAMMLGANALAQAPVIGITATPSDGQMTVGTDYVTAVTMAGGTPLLLPATADAPQLEAMLDRVDGVLLTGGVDVDPSHYGEERHPMLGEVNAARDAFELLLIDKCVQRRMPLFGVCRGLQVLNVALGGTLWQDIPSQVPSSTPHRLTDSTTLVAHEVNLAPRSTGARVLGVATLQVNSRHHQCVHDLAPCLKASAWAPDGVVEMVEGYPDKPILAVQWHPENFVAGGNRGAMLRFFEFLVSESRRYRQGLSGGGSWR